MWKKQKQQTWGYKFGAANAPLNDTNVTPHQLRKVLEGKPG